MLTHRQLLMSTPPSTPGDSCAASPAPCLHAFLGSIGTPVRSTVAGRHGLPTVTALGNP